MSENYYNYQLLLKEAALLYERHGVGRPDPFNIFSVLHKETDEVDLHSRFLHALLDYKKPGTETRENLTDFLLHVNVQGFELYGVEVKREWQNIDILLTNANKKALVIENKINAGDQPKQLWRYYNTLKKQNYLDKNIHLIYLTLDGREPTSDSVGDLDPEKITTVPYKELIPWLGCCQKHAYDEPALQESISQYLQLVQKLTGIDFRGKYMEALKNLCLENNNFVLVRDLNDAMLEAGQELLWNEIGCELKSEIPDLPDADISMNGLYYQLNEAGIKVKAHTKRIWFGIYCSKKEYKDKYDELEKVLKVVESETAIPGENLPWWRWSDAMYLDLGKPEDCKRCSNNADRQKYARETARGIAEYLKPVLKILEDIDPVNVIK